VSPVAVCVLVVVALVKPDRRGSSDSGGYSAGMSWHRVCPSMLELMCVAHASPCFGMPPILLHTGGGKSIQRIYQRQVQLLSLWLGGDSNSLANLV